MEKKYNRSVSQLKNMTKCGERFRLERIHRKDVQSRPAAWTALGIAFHHAFEAWERSGRTNDPVEMFAARYDEEIQRFKIEQPDLSLWMKPPNTKSTEVSIKNYRQRGITRDVPNYLKRCEEAEWEVMVLPDGSRALELEFELDLAGVVVKGSIDRIQWWPNMKMASIEDTKTGSPDEDEHDARQLGLYALAAQEIYDIDLTHGRYWFTKLDRPSEWMAMERYTREYLEKQYNILNDTIQDGLFLPSPGKQCGLCNVLPWCSEKGWLELGETLT